MNIEDLTIGEIKQIQAMFTAPSASAEKNQAGLTNGILGKKCIIRTYSAGVWFGEVVEKSSTECIIKNARRMYYWNNIKGISLSETSLYGLKDDSKIQAPVDKVLLQQIELIPCTDTAIESIESKPNYSC